MRIAVHEIVLENHVSEYFYQTPADPLGLIAQLLNFLYIVDLHAVDVLHNNDAVATVLGVYLGDIQMLMTFEKRSSMLCIGYFSLEVQLLHESARPCFEQ